MENENSDTCTPMSMAALFTITGKCKQPRCPGVYFTTIECVFYVYFTTIKIRIPTRTKRTNTVLEAEKCRSEWWEADLFRPRRVDPKQ